MSVTGRWLRASVRACARSRASAAGGSWTRHNGAQWLSTATPPTDTQQVEEKAATRRTIKLTPDERKLFDFLIYVQHLYAPTTQLRVAGGWVRDKLRGAESDDIDIVLDNLHGKAFANHITRFQRRRGMPMSSVGVVKANADKSKHLEVATVTIDGQTVDLVHLRAEVYSHDSRIPESTPFAHPADDASRRDITINALFYNLHTDFVEDFTGRGLDDLDAGIVRTPLEPLQTFLDDPLRVLRAIRFACDFEYALDPALVTAVLEHAEIKDAMIRKVSRERVGIEVRKMLTSTDGARAYQLLREFGLLEIVFENVQSQQDSAWTPLVQEQAGERIKFLQHCTSPDGRRRLGLEEAAAAIVSPLHLSEAPSLPNTPVHALLSSDELAVDEDVLLEATTAHLLERERALHNFPTDAVIDMFKVNVKWPKADAKRIALIVEAALAFPNLDHEQVAAGYRLKLFMWLVKYQNVLVPALAIRVCAASSATAAETKQTFQQYLAFFDHLATNHAPVGTPRRWRLDGRVVREELGPHAGARISKALEVLAVYDEALPSASREQQLAFLHRLAPMLQG